MSLFQRAWQGLFYKKGQFSKTAFFLSLGTLILLFLWPFQTLFVGVELFEWWVVPAFSVTAATAVMGILSSLYLFNHSKLVSGSSPEDFVELREKLDSVVNSVRGNNDDDTDG